MRSKARQLLTKKEFELVESGALENVKFHSAADLKENIELARKLRDKYRDLNRRQKAANKSQNPRTIEKAKIFGQLMDRFERQYKAI